MDSLTTGIIRSSSKTLTVTSTNFVDLRNEINDTHNKWKELNNKLNQQQLTLNLLLVLKIISKLLIFGFFYKKPDELYIHKLAEVNDLKKELGETYVKLEFADKSQIEKSWLDCVDTFKQMVSCDSVWDLTYSEIVDRVKTRTIAKTGIKRALISYKTKQIDFIHCDLEPLFLPNINGADIFIYPKFMIFYKDKRDFGLIDLKEVKAISELTGYVEEERVPKDTEILDHTWAKTNKDGSRDKRFNQNYQIPIVKYGQLTLRSGSGMDESFMFSNPNSFEAFDQALQKHLSLL